MIRLLAITGVPRLPDMNMAFGSTIADQLCSGSEWRALAKRGGLHTGSHTRPLPRELYHKEKKKIHKNLGWTSLHAQIVVEWSAVNAVQAISRFSAQSARPSPSVEKRSQLKRPTSEATVHATDWTRRPTESRLASSYAQVDGGGWGEYDGLM